MDKASASAVLLDDHLNVWRHLIHMLSGERPIVRRLERPSLRPPLEHAGEGVVSLPECVDWFGQVEQNRAVYRFLALQLAGRREFGTYAARPHGEGGEPSALEELFAVAEGVRVQHRLALEYPGSAAAAPQLAAAWIARGESEAQPSFGLVCDTLLALALAPPQARALPAWLPGETAEAVLQLLAPLARAEATARQSLSVASRLVRLLAAPVLRGSREGSVLREKRAVPAIEAVDVFELASEDPDNERSRALASAAPGSEDAEAAEDADASPAPAAQSGALSGRAVASAADSSEPEVDATPVHRTHRLHSPGEAYVYDEWDHTLGDYRRRRCRVHELALPTDSGAFFERTLRESRPLLAEVRRQFERIRPERYRPLRGLADGEDFDLNALTEARIEARARRSPNERIYTARTRQQRDVATLFLVDLSASTDQPYPEPGHPPPRRVVDTLREALVVMSAALQVLGDSYAIYGFSSQGPDRVEVYPVKAFDEALTPAVRGRVGGMLPKHGTRMGAALRHVISKFARCHARSRHLILLSDGFPQDHDYGPDRRSHAYGIEDTAVALREVSDAGATPFCITVDRAGNDYLRRMCDAAQYLVIEDVHALPRELPKIYRRVVSD
ncbi:MAG TPA: hypothetical protein VJR89_03665 [Polyangiales bacterium]|nr:hypothetical protein [Polyangiales bacterium]